MADEGTFPPAPDPEQTPFVGPDDPEAQFHQPAKSAPAPAPKKRRRRLWPKLLLALLLLLVLAVVLAPTLLSTRPARSYVVGKINRQLNGRVEVGSWSLGWNSPAKFSGIKVFDRDGVQVVELPSVTTELTLLNAARGRLKLGKVTVDGLNVLVRRDAQGNINLADLAKSSGPAPTTGGSGGSTAPKADPAPTKLPDVSGELHLVNCRATYEDRLQGQTFYFPSIAGQFKFPDINEPIETVLDVAAKVGEGRTGTIRLAGRADVAEGNVLRVDRAEIDENLTVQGVELASLSFLFGKDAGIQKLAGLTDAVLTVRYKGGERATAEGTVTSTGFTLGGPALKGDTFSTQKLALVLPPTTLNMAGSDDPKKWALRVGAAATDAITLTIDQGKVELASDAKVQSLLNLAENNPPGAPGRLRANLDLDVGVLARQMPNALALQEGLTLESGRLTHTADIELAANQATVRRLETHLTSVRGRNARGPVALQPIDLTFTATSFGGGLKNPDVRDLALDLKSGFANAQFTGKDISQLSGSATGDLKRLRDELGQVIDFGNLQLAGPFTVRIESKGDVVGGGSSTLHANATVTDLLVDGLGDNPPLRQKRVLVDVAGEVVRAPDQSMSALRGVKLTINTGEPTQPTVDALVNASVEFLKNATGEPVTSTKFDIPRFVVDLPRAKQEFGPLFPDTGDYAIARGTLSIGGSGNHDGSAFFADTRLALNNLTLRDGASGGRDVLRDETITLAARARGPSDLSTLALEAADVQGSVVSASIRNTLLQLKVGQGATARPAGTLEMVRSADVTADVPELAKLQALAEAFSPPHVETVAPAPVAAAPAPEPVSGSNVISRPRARARRPAAAARASATDPPAPVPPVRWSGAVNIKLAVGQQGDRVVVTPAVTGRNVAVARGAASESLGDVKFDSALSYIPIAPRPAPAANPAASQPAAGPAITEQLRDLQVARLDASFAGSRLGLAEPLVVSDVAGLQSLFASFAGPRPGAAPAASVKAALRGDGDLGRLFAVLNVLQGGDEAGGSYTGTYALEQRLTGDKDGLAFIGSVNIDNFATASRAVPGPKAPPTAAAGFAEKAIRLVNDVRLDTAKQALSVRNVSLDMETSKALQLKLSGDVLEFNTQRRLQNVQGTLGYDWAKVWEMVRPMLSPEQQENLKVRVAGQAQRTFALGGSYPAVGPGGQPLPFNQAIKFLTAHFQGGFDVVEVQGLTIQKLELPLTLRDGQLTVSYHDRPSDQNLPAVAACNGGKLNVGGATVDLSGDTPRLNLPKGHKLLEGVTLNPVFSDRFGEYINNPLFIGATEATGVVDLTVVECNRLPLDALVLKTAPENDGRAEFVFSIRDVFLGNSLLLEALKFAGEQSFARSMQGDIRESRVIIERGQTRQDVVFNLGEKDRPLRIEGTTWLETNAMNLTVTIPPKLLGQLGQAGREVLKVLPEGVPVPLTGTTSAPRLDVQQALTKVVGENVLPGLLENVLRRGTKEPKPRPGSNRSDPAMPAEGANADPAKPQPAPEDANREEAKPAKPDPLKDLFDIIGERARKDDAEKQKERDRKRRQRERRNNR